MYLQSDNNLLAHAPEVGGQDAKFFQLKRTKIKNLGEHASDPPDELDYKLTMLKAKFLMVERKFSCLVQK